MLPGRCFSSKLSNTVQWQDNVKTMTKIGEFEPFDLPSVYDYYIIYMALEDYSDFTLLGVSTMSFGVAQFKSASLTKRPHVTKP